MAFSSSIMTDGESRTSMSPIIRALLWVVQQLREAFPWEAHARYLICDRDNIFSAEVRGAIESMGLKVGRTAFRSPWQNGVAERWVGCLRQSLLHHVIALDENHLRRLVSEYVASHNADRLHCALEGGAPDGRPVEPRASPTAKLTALPRLGGLHHRYEWLDAARAHGLRRVGTFHLGRRHDSRTQRQVGADLPSIQMVTAPGSGVAA